MPSRSPGSIDVYLEAGAKRTFAGSLEWRWYRSGRDEASESRTPAATGCRRRRTAGNGGAPRHLARRAAWHVLDHAWEIQDRTPD